MTMIANLQVRDVTANIRGHEPARPIQVGYDGTRVVIVADGESADFLARILAQVGTNVNVEQAARALTVDKEQQDTWLHAVIDICTTRALMAGVPVDTVPVATQPPLEVVR